MANSKKLSIDHETLISMYQQMCLFRRFEERVGLAYTKRKFSGFCHLHIGQEGLAVGVQQVLRPTDYLISGYRSHTQAIGKGIKPGQVMAELFGKEGGICRGKGGSMHMFSEPLRFLGGHGIVGGQVPIAAGVGFTIRYQETDDICVCYLGDAATNQGQFFEAMNLAATWSLPVLFIVENNKYGMGTDIHRTTSVEHLWKRALAFDMTHSDVDGMDAMAVCDHVGKIAATMREGKKPHFLEALTYRYRGHSVSDPGTYRTKQEVEEYQKNYDPIKRLGSFLVEKKIATEEQLKEWDKAAKQEAKDAEEFADNSPNPSVDEAFDHVLV